MSNAFSKLAGRMAVLFALGLGLAGCGINDVPTQDEQVKAAWSQVQNEYQRRADLVPNLVATVKGYAAHEKDTLTAVIEARAKATQMVVPKDVLSNPQAFKAYEQNQGQLTTALGKLMVVSERYPELKANQNFLALQAQLEGTENRITVARRDYIAAVQVYNTNLRTIPGRWIAGMLYPEAKPYETFTATAPGAQNAPKVTF
jgi:LemA protein